MKKYRAFPWALTAVVGVSAMAQELTKDMGVVVIRSAQSSSMPTQIPTTMESVTAQQIVETINATDSEDALKYLPSLSVRKRFAGDYNHAVLASRASGSQNAARSAVYADGMPLSNFVGNDKFYAPRWGMVNPEEIERVDVMYGPFSAAYPGNSVGAVVDYVTRMPTKFEAHMKVGGFKQQFDQYNTHGSFSGKNASATLGSKSGDWSYWVHLSQQDVSAQPMMFVTAAPSASAAAATAVNGIVKTVDVYGNPVGILGTTTQYRTVQDHAKWKVAYDFSATTRATYTLGYWQNKSDGNPATYLIDATGAPVYQGANNLVSQDGTKYALSSSAFSASRESLKHYMHGFSVKTNTQDVFDWEVLTSLYDYRQDLNRASPSNTASALYAGTTRGTITDYGGTGWNNLALKGTWRPQGIQGAHIVDFGVQRDNYKLQIAKSDTVVAGWETADATGAPTQQSAGRAHLQSLYAQDAWKFAPRWKTVLGMRAEQWTTDSGLAYVAGNQAVAYGNRVENYLSPKAAVSHLWRDDLVLKASTGRAVRMPTVHEMYGSTTATSNVSYANNPNLKPEQSQTTELTAEKDLGHGLLRITAFFEDTRDAIVSQTSLINGVAKTNIQNIGRIASQGLEVAYSGSNLFLRGLDLSTSATYVDSRIKENAVAPDTIDKQQIRVPFWRANALANYRWSGQLSTSLGARYAGHQFGQLNNSDINGFAMTGNSKLFVLDARVLYKVDKQWSVAGGIDNLNNYKYWNYHQYPMRTLHAELRWDL
jgi:iron complex outermembrane receptor protein